jgi:hypothetical protein
MRLPQTMLPENFAMNNFEQILAASADTDFSSKCFECKKQILDGQWFCRLPQTSDGSAKILLCSPSCAYRHFTNFDDQTNNNH